MKVQIDNIERFLYWDAPTGFPDNKIKVFCEFEVGGAYEDWGWCVERNGKVFACHKNLQECLKIAREKIKHALEENKKEINK